MLDSGVFTKGLSKGQVGDDIKGHKVDYRDVRKYGSIGAEKHTPVEAVQISSAVPVGRSLHDGVPLLRPQFEVLADIGLEFEDRLGGKCVRHNLALASMLGPVPGVEDSAMDRHEGVVVVATFRIRI